MASENESRRTPAPPSVQGRRTAEPAADTRRIKPPPRMPGRASSAKPEPQAPPPQEDDEKYNWKKESVKAGLASVISCAPAWLISLLFHAVTVPVLAFITISSVEDPDEIVIASETAAVREELEEIAEFEIETPDELDYSESLSFETPVVDPGAIDFGEMSTPAEVLTSDISDLMVADSSVTEIGALFGSEGDGMSAFGEGLKGAATFFGAKSQGNRFIFVVDNSNSMTGGRMETALLELGKAVNKLQSDQYFYIIFYSDTAYPMFHPERVRDLLPATDENKRRVAQWLPQIEMCLRTAGEDAMKLALSLRPDVIYILGDGAFTDDTATLLIANPVKDVVIHTLGMQVKANAVADFSGIAMRHKGTYKDVGVTPEGVALSKRFPRPRHRTRSSIWGLKLPAEKK